ncbi:hypothetical protein HMJ29_01860 [Hymenobacter taeanensis]|uniref:Uncharacterized protein n=1 Tax=Hymenobacter taeanensis TaxID=2735321 RepID=A0A6M6BC47_9BACT|nr:MULTISPECIES: hypothetical protein [Hymenobacter]QJX45747.1 hypothetical protein HMJ29_01860 [Hymenobacter taeanensis]UOQ79587.1 hypothetical protein MUN83_12070 [Hymenobacter sp. 5414T-23]
MKRSCLAALLLLAACQRPQPESADPARSAEALPTATSPAAASTLKRVAPFLRGVWVKSDYLAAIKRTRSPYAASSNLTGIVALSIDPQQVTGDSLTIGASLNNHEGAAFNAILRQGLQLTSLPTTWPDYEHPTNFYELSYRLVAQDTIVLLNKYNEHKRLLHSVLFSRVPGVPFSETAPSDALQYSVNRQLLAGTYTATDAKGSKKQVRFSPTGQVEGLGGFRQYYLATDFVVTVENNLDNIIFDIGTKRQQDYVYTISQDTVRLYAARVAEPDLLRGPLQYTLVRVH